MLVPHPQQTHTNITHQPTRTHTHTHSTNPSIHTHTSYPHPPPWSPGSLCHSLTLSRLRYELNDSSDASPRTEGATARPRPSSRLEGRPEAPLCTLIITSRVVAGCHTVVLACAHPSVCVRARCVSTVRLSSSGCLMFQCLKGGSRARRARLCLEPQKVTALFKDICFPSRKRKAAT